MSLEEELERDEYSQRQQVRAAFDLISNMTWQMYGLVDGRYNGSHAQTFAFRRLAKLIQIREDMERIVREFDGMGSNKRWANMCEGYLGSINKDEANK